MNLQDQVLYRCIHAACARPLPRRVNFCPYCGTGQHDGVVKPAHEIKPPVVLDKPAPAPAVAAAAVAPQATASTFIPAPAPAQAPLPEPPAPPRQPQPRLAAAAAPPVRKPVRLRYWLMTLAALALIWFYAKPDPKRIEARVDEAVALAKDCKSVEAQAELLGLRTARATPEQLQRVQTALNNAKAGCDKKRAHAKAWDETEAAVNTALDAGEAAKAQARLSTFTKRWGDDAEARALRARIAALRESQAAPPKPVPAGEGAQAQSARNLIAEAERELALGNYKAASDKLETCVAMVEGSTECAAFKVHADKLLRDKQQCLASRREWSADRCR